MGGGIPPPFSGVQAVRASRIKRNRRRGASSFLTDEREKMSSKIPDDDLCVVCLDEEWGLPTMCCCKKRIHYDCLTRCLGDGTKFSHCRQSLVEILLRRVNWRFQDFYRKMFNIYIADGGHLLPGNRHAWNFLEPWGGQWDPVF